MKDVLLLLFKEDLSTTSNQYFNVIAEVRGNFELLCILLGDWTIFYKLIITCLLSMILILKVTSNCSCEIEVVE